MVQRLFLSLTALVLMASVALAAEGDVGKRYNVRPFELSLVPPVHVFHVDNKVVVGPSINIIYGKTTSSYGLELGVLLNRNLETMGGLQFAGLGNMTKGALYGLQGAGVWNSAGEVYGLQVATFANVTWGDGIGAQISPICNFVDRGDFYGFQFSAYNTSGITSGAHGSVWGVEIGWLANWLDGDFGGLQFGSIFNGMDGDVGGIQLAGFGNYVEGDVYGLQVGGLGNWSSGAFQGLQIGLANLNSIEQTLIDSRPGYNGAMVETWRITYARKETLGLQLGGFNWASIVRGGQISGTANIAVYDVRGFQAGLFNWADTVRGVQLGAVNVCRNLYGVQIGGINVATKNGLPFMVGLNAGW